MNHLKPTSAVLERQMLLQLGDRIKRHRRAQKISAQELALNLGISRNTLRAVEYGDPGVSMGTYVRVLSALGLVGDLALLAGDTMQPSPQGSAAAMSRRVKPVVRVIVSADDRHHQVQDLQSLAMHELAIEMLQTDPKYRAQALNKIDEWLKDGAHRSRSLLLEWKDIIESGKWRRVLGSSRRATELRQASPVTVLLSNAQRQEILEQVRKLKNGVSLGMSEVGHDA